MSCISLYDIDLAVEEPQRTAKLGLRGAMIWLSPPAGAPAYDDPIYDKFQAAQDLGMPMVLHAITGGAESRYAINYWDLMQLLKTSPVTTRPSAPLPPSSSPVFWSVSRVEADLRRKRHGLGPVVLQALRPRGAAWREGALPTKLDDETDRVLPAAALFHLHQRHAGGGRQGGHRRRQPDVVLGLPAQRLHLAEVDGRWPAPSR